MITREQQYAAKVFNQVGQEVKSKSDAYQKKYGSMAHTLPILVRTAGLAQALAFIDTGCEKNPEHRLLLGHLAATVGKEGKDDLLKSSRRAPLGEYMKLTHDVQAALVWYKRFAQSVLHVLAGDETSEEEPLETTAQGEKK